MRPSNPLHQLPLLGSPLRFIRSLRRAVSLPLLLLHRLQLAPPLLLLPPSLRFQQRCLLRLLSLHLRLVRRVYLRKTMTKRVARRDCWHRRSPASPPLGHPWANRSHSSSPRRMPHPPTAPARPLSLRPPRARSAAALWSPWRHAHAARPLPPSFHSPSISSMVADQTGCA
jgi:hypothetical protein